MLLLVARNDSFCQKLYRRMRNLSTNEDQHTPVFIWFNTNQRTKGHKILFTSHLWLHHRPTQKQWIWQPHGHGRPWIYKGGNFYLLQQDDWCHTHSTKLYWSHILMLRTSWLLSIWPRPIIFLTSLQRNGLTPRNQNTQKHGISSSDWWRNRKGQPRAWNLFSNLLLQQPQNVETTQLPHGVQSQPKGPLHHKTDPVLPHDGVRTERYPLDIR